MTLISSISGIRGTIGGNPGENLTPDDILRFAKAFALFIRSNSEKKHPTIVIGRDARVSGQMVESILSGTLSAMGVHSISLGLTTTPTTEMAVTDLKADGGIIITASHNPANWNALKLLNQRGEFLSQEEGIKLDEYMHQLDQTYSQYDEIGTIEKGSNYIQEHINKILKLPLVNSKLIQKANFSIVVDAINSAGAISVEPLLKALGVKNIIILNGEPNGIFAHNPEPLPANLKELSDAVVQHNAHLGISVDPDVDRLAFVMENGKMFGEEYTLVAVSDYILKNTPGNTVSNLSSTRALQILTEQYGQHYSSSAVGEVNVVKKMKETNAIIGGEGNGGVIYPELHYGRDALVGIALFLTHLAQSDITMTAMREEYPDFFIAKHKLSTEGKQIGFDQMKLQMKNAFHNCQFDETDGLKITFPNGDWVHLRTSNTEPIIRIYAECKNEPEANTLAEEIKNTITKIIEP